MDGYNITQLHPETAFEKHVFYRDMFAHYLRWSHVLKLAEIGQKVLDVGCGSGNIYEVFYRNRFNPGRFVGLDIRKQTIEQNKTKFPKAEWQAVDIVKEALPNDDWDIITSFETLEHVGKQNVATVLDNIKQVAKPNTTILISTPCYDEKVGAADNHTYDSGDGRGVQPQELTYQELKALLEERFEIVKVYGTFASIKDYKHLLTGWQLEMFNHLKGYFDTNILSNVMAPFFPEQSRNCLWVLKLK